MVNSDFRNLWYNYKSEVIFGGMLSAVLVVSALLSRYIPEGFFNQFLNPALSMAFAAICIFSAVLCFKHNDGIRIRRIWAGMLIGWAAWEIMSVVAMTMLPSVMAVGTDTLSALTMVIACGFAWLLFIYPTELLRPGWLNWKRALLQLAPLFALGALDYVVTFDLRWLIALYPIGLIVSLSQHIRKYRVWCEENFSTLDDIDVQWIVRYVIMLLLSGMVFYWLCISDEPAHAFTQQWYLIFVLAYTTENVLYRPDPWKRLRSTASDEPEEPNPANTGYRAMLEKWIEEDKPYLNPDFQLSDLRQVLPLNRTYLSQLINTEYGCSFYHWVSSLRINEAKRLMNDHPDMKMQEVAERCGFSSPVVFSRVFTRETGTTPSKWISVRDNPE